MTEAEWLGDPDTGLVLGFLEGKVSERKLRLFAQACCVRALRYLQGEIKLLVRRTEQTADTPENDRRLASSWRWHYNRRHDPPDWIADEGDGRPYRFAVAQAKAALTRAPKARQRAERETQQQLLRCVFGNPFRRSPPLLPPVLDWNDGSVRRIAQEIDEQRAFDSLPVLADALLDAGCADEELLAHCRTAGPHTRGCWAVDLILGRG